MSKVRGIVNAVDRRIREEQLQDEVKRKHYNTLKTYAEKYEQERYKTEAQKQHERYRRNQKRKGTAVELKVQPAKKYVAKPGSYFYGPLKKLVTDFGNLREVTDYMTFGQLMKYEERDGKLFNLKTGKLAYDPTTGECFE